MKRTAVILALALGLATQGAMAKTLNVVSSFSVLGDMVQQVGGEHVHVDTLVAAGSGDQRQGGTNEHSVGV